MSFAVGYNALTLQLTFSLICTASCGVLDHYDTILSLLKLILWYWTGCNKTGYLLKCHYGTIRIVLYHGADSFESNSTFKHDKH